jgi:predicted Zn-dependent peptidase
MASSRFGCQAVTLANGLRVLAAPAPHIHRAHVALYVKVGSRYETRATNGISHFLEHMMYRGTERLRSAHAVNLAFEELGGYLHASTQTDYGVFSVTLPAESLDAASALFGEVITSPAFFDIDVEKGIVCQELLEDLDDEGRQVDADNLSRALIYPDHPLGFTLTGDEERVRSFDLPLVRQHYQRHYVAAGSVLVYTGAIDAKRAILFAERDFGVLRAADAVVSPPPTHTQTKPRIHVLPNQSSQTELRVCFRALPESAAERPALDLLMRVIDDGMSTRLYHRICDDKGLCYDVSAGYESYEDDGVVDFAAGVQHARVARVTSEILGLMAELAREGPTEEEMVKAKKRHAWDMRSLFDSPEELATLYGLGELWNHPESAEERLTALARVTRDEVREVARLVSSPSRLNVVAVGMLDREELKRLSEAVKMVSPTAG